MVNPSKMVNSPKMKNHVRVHVNLSKMKIHTRRMATSPRGSAEQKLLKLSRFSAWFWCSSAALKWLGTMQRAQPTANYRSGLALAQGEAVGARRC